MCDTLVYRDRDSFWFCKNSGREPDEPQHVEYYPAYIAEHEQTTTYIEVEVPAQRSAVLLSRPEWMWGAEIGVNEHGVAIGNEAVYTKLIEQTETSLLGMDLLRLTLEQARTAPEACNILIGYLQKYGQGGPASYRYKNFRYDNSFIIADHESSFIIETAGRFWAKKKIKNMAAISNDLSLTNNYDDLHKGAKDYALQQEWWDGTGDFDFRATFRTDVIPKAAKSSERRACNLNNLARIDPQSVNEQDFMGLLRTHKYDQPSSNADVCLHAEGKYRPSATTNSMIVKLNDRAMPRVWSSFGQPCENAYSLVELNKFEVKKTS